MAAPNMTRTESEQRRETRDEVAHDKNWFEKLNMFYFISCETRVIATSSQSHHSAFRKMYEQDKRRWR